MIACTAVKPKAKKQPTCDCRAYHFRHRLGGGACFGKHHGPFCGKCGEPAEPERADFGIGHYEAWGRSGIHRDEAIVSRCCEAELFEDASLTEPYHHDE